ncbi:MAG: hypothetical protein GXY86_03000 [Firmicutes bacterium]|nr:hypothetical protein [Bacillota bacterium]
MKRKVKMTGIILVAILILVSLIRFTTDQFDLAKEKKVMIGFETLMDNKEVGVEEIIQYVNQNIDTVSRNDAATLVKGIERIQNANLPKWEKRFENEALQKELAQVYQENGWSLDDFKGIRDDKLKTIVVEAISNGYKVETAEGFFFPVIDYDFYDQYHQAVTLDLSTYLEIMVVESDRTPVKDAALMISWEEILSRALRQEEFIKEYAASTQVEAMENLIKRYVTFALFGCNNTPLFSYENKEIVLEAKKAFLNHPWNEERGSFSALMKEYLKVLKENEYKLTEEVDKFRKKAVGSF